MLILLVLFASLPFLVLFRLLKRDYKGFVKRLVIWVIACILLLVWALPEYARLVNKVNFERCCSNLSYIAGALGLYAAKNNGVYPESLKIIYLGKGKEHPRCPVSGKYYHTGYQVSEDKTSFTIFCSADHKRPKGSPKGYYPQYSSKFRLDKGLPEKGW